MSSASETSPPCPICGKPARDPFSPFCSRRCADIDLGRWLKGGYVIPGRPEEGAENGAEKGADVPSDADENPDQ